MNINTAVRVNNKNVRVIQNTFKNHEGILRREVFLAYKKVRLSAQRYSVSVYSLDDLAKMKHPYSKLRPNPPMDPVYINIQNTNTPAFHDGWRVYTGRNFVSLNNLSKSAVFIQVSGSHSSRMMLRPIFKKLQTLIKRRLNEALRAAARQL